MKKVKVKMNKAVYLGFSILEISKTLMFGFWYDYIKLSTRRNNCTWIQITLLFIINLDVYEDIAGDVHKIFNTWNYDKDVNRPLPIGKSKHN